MVTIQLKLQIGSKASNVHFEGRRKPIHGSLTVVVLTTEHPQIEHLMLSAC